MLLFTTHHMCYHMFMYDEKDKNNNSQINGSIKYISNIHAWRGDAK